MPRNFGQKYQIPIWYWYFLGMPNFWFPIDITTLDRRECTDVCDRVQKVQSSAVDGQEAVSGAVTAALRGTAHHEKRRPEQWPGAQRLCG